MRFFKWAVFFGTVLFLVNSVYARPDMAVLNFSSNVPESRRKQFQWELAEYLHKKGITTFNVSSLYIKKMVKNFYQKKAVSKDDLVKIGLKVNAEFLVWGDIKKTHASVFTVTIQVLDVKKEKFIYSKKFNTKTFDGSLAYIPAISVDVSKRVYYRKRYKYPHNIYAAYAYLSANDSFDNTITDGHGYSIGYDYRFLNTNIVLGVDTQLFFVDGNKTNTEKAYMLPLTANIGYNYTLGIFHAAPRFHLGAIHNSVYYYKNAQKNDYIVKKSFLLLGKLSIRLSIDVYDPLTFICGYEYAVVENNTFRTYQSLYSGVQFKFF